MSLFRRTAEPTLVDEAVLVIDQHALPYRSPDWYGHANYHVRVFRPENVRKPIVVMGDLSNDPVASITNKCPEVTAIVANLVLGRPGVHPGRLEDHARWVTYFPAGTFGESFTEVHGFDVVPGYEPQLVTNRYRHLRREDAEELVGGSLRTWQGRHYTVAKLQRRGVRVMRVHSAG
ncbi:MULTISPECIES: hypothetical protein [Streptomyces]|uniref:Uncharacterized protein n=1 Tax=Streptomyces edwardsiae TaxID=3075527 RepID=A0ABU2PLV5_9ACTN|nr:hypothetical protein [Streptomyces sp. DSM 41636]MDT0393143.1 hypothetical protein [Streptomyces sp. DSM 41636]